MLLPLMTAVTLLTQCRSSNRQTNAETMDQPQEDPISLTMIGDTREQIWTWQQNNPNGKLEKATLRVTRSKHQGGGELISFPEKIDYHQTSHREGNTTITMITGYLPRQRVVFQRMRSDLPGELNLELRLTPTSDSLSPESSVAIARQLCHQSAPASQCWLLPFESEVAASNGALHTQGEGELLIIWHIPSSPEKLVHHWRDLLQAYTPPHSPHVDLSALADRLENAAQLSMK